MEMNIFHIFRVLLDKGLILSGILKTYYNLQCGLHFTCEVSLMFYKGLFGHSILEFANIVRKYKLKSEKKKPTRF